ncbi:hypothetical protein FB45DRAFT_938727 [Roridomyces roridus]|uniref:F-box domain-containing protein n=1 Tax=Roridomyces roridus TaxID=1738132 RepID=A0AAD7FCZ8_9AGAR|nr:hypothetical protein FB45DRAFT_938727 [Roridomyces roridus]
MSAPPRLLERQQLRKALTGYPVLTLPAEVTSEIFMQFLPPYPQRPSLVGPLSPSFLLRICRQWRDVALATPALWSTVALDMESLHARQLSLLNSWLQRSGHCPLSIALVCPFNTQHTPYITALAEAILTHSSRFREMDLRIPLEDLARFTAPMPLLRSLTVGPTQYLTAKSRIPGQLPWSPFLHAPMLKDVVLSLFFNPFCITLPWSHVTSLTATLFCNEAAEILRHTTILEICNIDIYNSVNGNLPQVTAITPIPVRSLRLLLKDTDHRQDTATMQQFFSMLAFPALEALAVSECFLGADPIAAILSLCQQGYPQRIAIHHACTARSVFESAFPGAELSVASLES